MGFGRYFIPSDDLYALLILPICVSIIMKNSYVFLIKCSENLEKLTGFSSLLLYLIYYYVLVRVCEDHLNLTELEKGGVFLDNCGYSSLTVYQNLLSSEVNCIVEI